MADPTNPELWSLLTETPGVGVSIIDTEGRLLFFNEAALRLFEGRDDVDYAGKTMADFRPPEFVQERLELIRRVVETQQPVRLRSIYHGTPIESKIWPLPDTQPPFSRVITISRRTSDFSTEHRDEAPAIESKYIELGELNVLTQRELEVLVLLGHGRSVPQVAKTLHRSPKTIERHKSSIGKKLQVQSQAAMVRIVTTMGLQLDHAKLRRLNPNPPTIRPEDQ